ncbi:MAG TPA: hypothetical protein DCM67_03330, partial [Propionibacteriaceae bacterium]|nr:hypothetical protein [Propionibacteriaceae bacterium]
AGGWAEDFAEPPGLLAHYRRLRETPSVEVTQRTEWNVRDSTATLAVGASSRSPGLALTIDFAHAFGKPVRCVQPTEVDATLAFLVGLPHPTVLNIAGPRKSEQPGVYLAAAHWLRRLLRQWPTTQKGGAES